MLYKKSFLMQLILLQLSNIVGFSSFAPQITNSPRDDNAKRGDITLQNTAFFTIETWTNLHAFLKGTDRNKALQRSLPNTPAADRIQVTYQQFTTALQNIIDLQITTLNTTSNHQTMLNPDPDRLYLQKLIVPHQSTIYFFGDLHGDIASLMLCIDYLRHQKIIDNNWNIKKGHYIFFGGDLVDRGEFGVEVIATLCHLKLQNPHNVFLIRGNHEDIAINRRNGFYAEYTAKFKDKLNDKTELKKFNALLQEFYAALPVALCLGTQEGNKTYYLQLCHGGLELYDLHPLLKHNGKQLSSRGEQLSSHIMTSINRKDFLTDIFKDHPDLKASLRIETQYVEDLPQLQAYMHETTPISLSSGFMWNDFSAASEASIPVTRFIPGRGLQLGSTLAHAIFEAISLPQHQVVGILRAHQHNKSMYQLLPCTSCNQSVYKIPWKSPNYGAQHHAVTTVATCMFTPSPSFVRISFDKPSIATDHISGWMMTNFYIPDFNEKMLKPGIEKTVTWSLKGPIPFEEWKNERDF